MKNLIDITNLEFRYRNQTKLLSNLNLEVKSGGIYGLLGKNGEGKSTLLKLISGLLFPLKGSISVLEAEPQKRLPKMLQGIFFLPEDMAVSTLSLKRYVKTYAPFYPKFRLSLFYNYVNEFGLDPLTKDLSTMSYGQKKKFMIAFGLSTNAKIILMDEPTNGLDIPSKGVFRRIVASAIDEDCSIVISTHQVLDLDNLIDNIIIMEEHEIVFNQSIENILRKMYFDTDNKIKTENKLIYKEDTIKGTLQVCENIAGEESNLNIELLFNAVVARKEIVKELFEKEKTRL